MLYRPLEDDARDILVKAASGLGMDAATLAGETKIPEAVILGALGKAGYPAISEIPDATWLTLAKALKLHGPSVLAIARGKFRPDVRLPETVACITTRQRMLEVNAWVASNPDSGAALLFDTGADARPLLGHLAQRQCKPSILFLTHDHVDHVIALPEIRAAFPNLTLYSPSLDHVYGTQILPESGVVDSPLGRVLCLPTPGHTDGGTSYFLPDLPRPICVVGDALFAGSIGGPRFSYPDALDSLRKNVLSLPANTILCPGHGPATTIALETSHNPFFVTGL